MSRPEWRKSSRSDSGGGNCVEVAEISAGLTSSSSRES
ncbi:MAG: hypothetical protein JWP48_2815 [Actinoallomurus sp.]|jgi:hypothetical protein|nr:hypothetical protein [Actinoallomurus sp.]